MNRKEFLAALGALIALPAAIAEKSPSFIEPEPPPTKPTNESPFPGALRVDSWKMDSYTGLPGGGVIYGPITISMETEVGHFEFYPGRANVNPSPDEKWIEITFQESGGYGTQFSPHLLKIPESGIGPGWFRLGAFYT